MNNRNKKEDIALKHFLKLTLVFNVNGTFMVVFMPKFPVL